MERFPPAKVAGASATAVDSCRGRLFQPHLTRDQRYQVPTVACLHGWLSPGNRPTLNHCLLALVATWPRCLSVDAIDPKLCGASPDPTRPPPTASSPPFSVFLSTHPSTTPRLLVLSPRSSSTPLPATPSRRRSEPRGSTLSTLVARLGFSIAALVALPIRFSGRHSLDQSRSVRIYFRIARVGDFVHRPSPSPHSLDCINPFSGRVGILVLSTGSFVSSRGRQTSRRAQVSVHRERDVKATRLSGLVHATRYTSRPFHPVALTMGLP